MDLRHIPPNPGVYLMLDESGQIIYIGKAKNLKKRVSSYFNRQNKEYKTELLVAQIKDIQWITTASEGEAFLLENNLIKKHQPRYNILLKDSKSYPFIALDFNEPFPRVYRTRENHRRGVKYYGPYAAAFAADQMIDMAVKYFQLRVCRCKISREVPAKKPCLYYHIQKCPGYCLLKVPEAQYLEQVSRFVKFLRGKYAGLEKELKTRMEEESKALEFEKAAKIRDLLSAVAQIKEKQKVYLATDDDLDVLGFFEGREKIFLTLLHFAEGRLIHKRTFQSEPLLEKEELLSQLLKDYYEKNPLPDKIYLPFDLEEMKELEEFLKDRAKTRTEILAPAAGVGISLLRMANENARLESLAFEKLTAREHSLLKLKTLLALPAEPRRIECYDIATIEGKWSVGACSSVFNGRPDKAHYRHFKIKWVEGQDDYAMLKETLIRRMGLKNSPLPDLFLIDGGKGQLSAALEVLVKLNVQIPVVSIAKKEELIFVPYRPDPIKLEIKDPALQVLILARDEVHRFANVLHGKLKLKTMKATRIEELPGMGPKRRQALLLKYGSLEEMKKAPVEELMKTARISRELAEKIREL